MTPTPFNLNGENCKWTNQFEERKYLSKVIEDTAKEEEEKQ